MHDPDILLRRHVGQVGLQHFESDGSHLQRRQPRIYAAYLERLEEAGDVPLQLEGFVAEGAGRLGHGVAQSYGRVENGYLGLIRRQHLAAEVDEMFAGVVFHSCCSPY